MSRPSADKKPTEYFDAWSHYRVSDEQIRAATEEQPHDEEKDDGPEGDDLDAA